MVESLLAPLPPGVEVLYQKQMSHHLLPSMGREWLPSMTHGFLIRDPAPMLASLEENRPPVHAEIAREIAKLVKSCGEEHVLVVPGDPADATYAAQAPTLHPGIVAALCEVLSDDQIRSVLGGNLVRVLATRR